MRTRPLIIAAVALLTGAALAAVLWLADLGESAGREAGTTLRDVAGDPRRYEGRTVTVGGEYAENDYFSTVRIKGRAYVLGERGFVLAGDRRAIFVGAPASELASLEAGERVLVDAEVARVSRFRARVIEAALSREGGDVDGVDLDLIPSRPGEPFLVLRGINRSP